MFQLHPKKIKPIKNKTIPNPLRPRFRKKSQANIYFLSQRKFNAEKKTRILKNLKLISFLFVVLIAGYYLSN